MDKLKVMIVDDEPGMRMAVERALEGRRLAFPEFEAALELEVIGAESGEQALSIIAQDQVDLLLLDHKLPGLSGLEVLHRLAEKPSDLITIMITAYASLETAISATKRGAYDFLAKPFTPEELKAAVNKAAKHLLLQREARRLAEEKRRVRFEFVSVLAHELKAPLAAVEQYLGLLEDPELAPDSRQKMIERSRARIQAMRKLILDLLDLTRLESGQKKRELAEHNLVEIAAAVIETQTPTADERGISIQLQAPERIIIPADRWELETILMNLVSNAVKYNLDQGRVEVRLEDRPGSASIRVADTGIGIAEEDQQRLFKEFARVVSGQTEKIAGSGLGLSIVKKIAALYDGKIKLESRPGRGSVFEVELMKKPAGQG